MKRSLFVGLLHIAILGGLFLFSSGRAQSEPLPWPKDLQVQEVEADVIGGVIVWIGPAGDWAVETASRWAPLTSPTRRRRTRIFPLT